MNEDEIVHDKCGCIHADGVHDEKCLKRSYRVYDIIKDRTFVIYVCNEYLRLMLHQKYYFRDIALNYDFGYVLTDIFSNYVHYKSFGLRKMYRNDFMDRCISYQFCDRPFLSSEISLKEAVEVCCKPYYYGELTSMVIRDFTEYINQNTYKKYKTKYNEAGRLIRKINNVRWSERQMIIQELLTILLTLKTK